MIVVEIGYTKYVMTKEKAMQFVECLESAEIYEKKYWTADKRKELGMAEGADYTYHVYSNTSHINMSIITDSHYQMAKLAGAPMD